MFTYLHIYLNIFRCSEKSELLTASDIACFPGGNTPRSITPIGGHWTNHSMTSDHVTNTITPVGEPWTNQSNDLDQTKDSGLWLPTNQLSSYDQNILIQSESNFKSNVS
jgi:hypothetical protein